VIPITGESGRLHDLAEAIGCKDIFPIPDGVGGRFSILSAVGLLPAVVMGLDVEHLLEGAVASTSDSRPRLREKIPCSITWHVAADGNSPWGDHPRAFDLGQGAGGRRAVVRPASFGKSWQEWSRRNAFDGRQYARPPFARPAASGRRRDKIITNLIVDHAHRDPVVIERSDFDQDNLNSLSGKTLPELLRAAYTGTNQAYAEDFRRTATIHLPRLDEGSLGQLFQMFMLATVVEGRLVGINPYGQPGVEGYKRT